MARTTGSNYCNRSLTFSATTNQIATLNGSSAAVSYGAAGNLTRDGNTSGTHT